MQNKLYLLCIKVSKIVKSEINFYRNCSQENRRNYLLKCFMNCFSGCKCLQTFIWKIVKSVNYVCVIHLSLSLTEYKEEIELSLILLWTTISGKIMIQWTTQNFPHFQMEDWEQFLFQGFRLFLTRYLKFFWSWKETDWADCTVLSKDSVV